MSILENPAAWKRILMVAPHPDDESLGAGGLLQHAVRCGAKSRILFLTNGDNNPWPQRASEMRWKIGAAERERWGNRRRAEALNALARLGIPANCARFLNFPDQGITQLLLSGDDSLVSRLLSEITEFQPDLLVVPSINDLHRDHNAFAVLFQFALERLPAAQKKLTQLHFVIHQRERSSAQAPEMVLRLSSEEQEQKRKAILCHETQMQLSRRRFLAFARETECFHSGVERQKEFDLTHPIQSAQFNGGNLRLQLSAKPFFRKRFLRIVADDSSSGRSSISIELPKRDALVNVIDSISGAIIAQAKFQKNELLIPRSVLPVARRLFAKLEISPAFYDLAGWREIALEPNENSFPTQIISETAAPRLCVVLPCYNVASTCGTVLRRIVECADHVIAVNDGSTDGTEAVLKAVVAESGGRIRLHSYPENRGKGFALMEGFRLALAETPFDLLVTIDADGQHRTEDIAKIAELWRLQRAEFIIGERLALKAMPLRSRFGNSLTATILRWFYPISPRDTQSGLRGMDRNFVQEIVRSIKPQRYETELRILLLALEKPRRISTTAIETIYFDSNRLSHFRPVLDSARIYWVLLRGLFRSLVNNRV